MKTVVGKDLEADHRRIREVRAGIPDGLGLAIDANTSFTHADARALGRTASEVGLEWFEEPIAHTDIEGQAELNRTLDVPVSGYQSHTPHYPAREHLEAGALEIYQPALDLCGGVTGGQAVATLVEAYNKQFVPHAFGPAINYAASLHVAAASPVCDLIEFAVYDDEIDDTGRFVASPYVANQDAIYVQDGGVIEPPEEPGLGLELDEDRLEEYRID
jgi:L-alanine-DL-glutamate epimerase-like enolase superfamily enzyme